MLNKLYHQRKIQLNSKGVNKIVTAGGVNTDKSANDIVNYNMNQRQTLNLSWFDVFLYKYVKCNCFSIFKGPKYYKGKIIYEGEQRLKNEADLGNIVQNVRKNRVLAQSILDKENYVLMKYQQHKFIDVAENTQRPKYTNEDSQVNNQPSLDDIRDYQQVLQVDTARPSGFGTSDMEMRINTLLSQNVMRENICKAQSIKQLKTGGNDGS